MQTGRIRRSLCLLCLGLAAVVAAQSKTPSVLERVQRVDDPELGELIRVAMAVEGRENLSQSEKLELIRKVTLNYSQIKLLDQQIEEVSRKLQAETGPAEMRYELLLARTELEAKLAAELTNLREVMGVVPKYPFDRQPVESLHTWLRLNPIDEDRVYVLDTVKPIFEDWHATRFEQLGLISQKETLDLVRAKLREPNNLPMRVEILWTNKAAEELRDKAVRLVREMGAAMQTEVSLGRNYFIGDGEAPFFLREGRITTFYPGPVRRPEGPPDDFMASGLVALQDLHQHVLWRITYQWNLPFTFRIEYDRASSDLAQKVADEIRTTAKRLGVTAVVGIKPVPVEPLPETAFVGRWRAVASGSEVREIVLRPDGQSQLMTAGRSAQGGTALEGRWFLATRVIIIDAPRFEKGGYRTAYRAHINMDGNLVLDEGEVQPQGSFARGSLSMVFEKVE